MRRAVSLDCALQSEFWDDAVTLPASNLSTDGMFIETPLALAPGEDVIVSFRPPGAQRNELVWAAARVVRAARRRERQGMALEFTYCSDSHKDLLASSLYGRPPRLPDAPTPPPLPARDAAVRPLSSITVVDVPAEITHGPAPADAIEAHVVSPRESAPPNLELNPLATMQVMDEELHIDPNATMQVFDDELRD